MRLSRGAGRAPARRSSRCPRRSRQLPVRRRAVIGRRLDHDVAVDSGCNSRSAAGPSASFLRSALPGRPRMRGAARNGLRSATASRKSLAMLSRGPAEDVELRLFLDRERRGLVLEELERGWRALGEDDRGRPRRRISARVEDQCAARLPDGARALDVARMILEENPEEGAQHGRGGLHFSTVPHADRELDGSLAVDDRLRDSCAPAGNAAGSSPAAPGVPPLPD